MVDLKRWIERDGLYLIVIAFALFACIWTLGAVDDYKTEIDIYYIQELQDCGCNAYVFNQSFKLSLPLTHAGFLNGSKGYD